MNVGHPIAAEPEGGGYSCSGNWTPAGMCSTVQSLGEMLTHDTFTLFFGDHILHDNIALSARLDPTGMGLLRPQSGQDEL